MYLPFSPASSSLHYLQSLRTYRRQFVHYYSALYLTLLRIRISMFEYHPNTGIIFTFVPYETRFLHYRQISFYRSRSHRQSLRHLSPTFTPTSSPRSAITSSIVLRWIIAITPPPFSSIVGNGKLARSNSSAILTMSFGTGKQVI